MAGASEHAAAFLLVRLSSFGDVVLAEPVAREIKRAFGPCRVVFAAYDRYAGIPALMSSVDQVVPIVRGEGGTPKALAGARFDAVVDLQNNLRSRTLVRGLDARRVLRYSRQYLRRFLCVYLPWVWKGSLRHTVDLYLDSLGPMGIEAAAQIAPKLVVPQVPRSDLGGFAGGGRLAGVCPGASSEHKSWGRQRFAELVRQLRGRGYGIRVVGSAADRCEVEGVVAEACGRGDPGIIGHVTDDVAAMSDLLSGCGAVVSNDSGLMHLAAAAGSRAIGIFGPTSPLLGFAPLGPGCRVVTLNARCSPCSYHGNRPCKMKTRFCMEAIHPNEVASIVDDTAGTGASV